MGILLIPASFLRKVEGQEWSDVAILQCKSYTVKFVQMHVCCWYLRYLQLTMEANVGTARGMFNDLHIVMYRSNN